MLEAWIVVGVMLEASNGEAEASQGGAVPNAHDRRISGRGGSNTHGPPYSRAGWFLTTIERPPP